MGVETLSVRDQSLFSLAENKQSEVNRSVAWHNIHHLLPHAGDTLRAYLSRRYGLRGGALDYDQPNLGLVVGEVDERTTGQAEYLRALIGKPFKAYSFAELQGERTLIVPYIHTSDAHATVNRFGQESWGFPPEMVTPLKQKVTFHERVTNSDVEGFEVPDYVIATGDDVVEKAQKVLSDARGLYDRYAGELSRKYSLGVMIRGDESDGNYGSCLVKENEQNGIEVIPDGSPSKDIPPFKPGEWDAALQKAQELSQKSNNPQFVVSRFIDYQSTPGLSLVIKNGQVTSLGWNVQIMAEHSTACAGTTGYNTELDTHFREARNAKEVSLHEVAEREIGIYNHGRQLQDDYEGRTESDFTAFLKETAAKADINFGTVTGVANVDIMIPGRLEKELRRARGQNPDGYYVAESNSRWTNYTDAIMLGVGVTRRRPSITGMLEVVNEGITAIDGYKDPFHAQYDPVVVRETVFERDQLLQQDGYNARVIVRVPDRPVAVVFLGDRSIAKSVLNGAIQDTVHAKGT